MNPNATVSYMAAQADRQLVEAKAARAWIVDEAARDRTPGSGLVRLPLRLLATLASRIGGHHGIVGPPWVVPTLCGAADGPLVVLEERAVAVAAGGGTPAGVRGDGRQPRPGGGVWR